MRPQHDVAAEFSAVIARREAGDHLPLAGLLFAVKANIDVEGIATTAGCPAFAYQPERDSTVVARLREAGAVLLGVTNMDQFATGLVGTRSPYGAVRSSIDDSRISGGSSSGSAVAVAENIVDFALGTDTAGSGRVPAAFQGLYGLKPTRGWVPTSGVVPACRSLDVVTVMAHDLKLAQEVVEIMAGPDGRDPTCRSAPAGAPRVTEPRLGVPIAGQLGELSAGWAEAFEETVSHYRAAGLAVLEVDIEPLLEAAAMLYEGAFVAERYAAVGHFIDSHPQDVDATVAAIITSAQDIPAWRLYRDMERLDHKKAYSRKLFEQIDALLLPTTVEHPTFDAVAKAPIEVNTRLGRFTNFANLLDLAALAVPSGTVDGLPFGTQLLGPAFSDGLLADIARSAPGQIR